MAHTSILSQLLQKVNIDLRAPVDCENNLQSLMKSCRDVSNNETYNEIYQKAADMTSPEEISMPRNVKHQTMRSNLQAESPMNYYLRNHFYLLLNSVILQLDQRFSFHAKVVTPLIQKSKLSSCCGKDFVKIILMVWFGKRLTYKLCQPDIFPAIKILLSIRRNTSSIFCYCRTIVFYATTDKIGFPNNYGSNSSGRSVPNIYP